MSIVQQKLSAPHTARQAVRASDGGATEPPPQTISPGEMVLLNEDKIPLGAMVLVPSNWVMQ